MTEKPTPRALTRWIVEGRPTPFAGGENERLWKATLAAAIPPVDPLVRPTGIRAHFAVVPRHETPDLDNLMEPLLSVLVGTRGWFDGRRPNIEWFTATKQPSASPGVMIELATGAPPMPWPRALASFTYSGDLPISATDAVLSGWIESARRQHIPEPVELAVHVAFHRATLNLGDIATGAVKSTLDALWPLLGGNPGAPHDHRICQLTVMRNPVEPPSDGVDVVISPVGAES